MGLFLSAGLLFEWVLVFECEEGFSVFILNRLYFFEFQRFFSWNDHSCIFFLKNSFHILLIRIWCFPFIFCKFFHDSLETEFYWVTDLRSLFSRSAIFTFCRCCVIANILCCGKNRRSDTSSDNCWDNEYFFHGLYFCMKYLRNKL